jgi:ABC-type uncharacterized transport system substrate-binding protein
MLTGNTPVTAAAQRVTTTIPIVMVLAVTGLSSQIPDLAGKRLQLLQEVLPHIARVAVLWDPDVASGRRVLVTETEVAARAPGLSLQLPKQGTFQLSNRASLS